MPVSQNGWATAPTTASYTVPGTNVPLRLRTGDAATVLLYVAARFDREVEDIDNARGHLDDWGYAARDVRGGTDTSNHASGTAMDLNATRHPLGSDPRTNFTAGQITALHRIVRDPILGGVVRWGGNYAGRKDPMHFELIRDAAQVRAAAQRIREDDLLTIEDVKAAVRAVLMEERVIQSDEPGETFISRDRALYRAYSRAKVAGDAVENRKP